jgi:ribosome biogenesis GTPase
MPQEGLVLKSTGKWYLVQCENQEPIACRIRGKLRLEGLVATNPIAVGDVVMLADERDEESKGIITEILPRSNYLVRKSTNLSKQVQILAANVDRAYLVVTLKAPFTQPAFIDRFLVAAESFRIPVSILFNKTDLYGQKEQDKQLDLTQVYTKLGYSCHAITLVQDSNLDWLREEIYGNKVIIAGHSGVGKSTLVNALDPDIHLRIGEISKAHQQGQHTTTFAEMYPLSSGGYIIDTPGIRAFGLIDLEKQHLAHYFPEMRKRMEDCKFHNCMHKNEPGCAVLSALENGEIAEIRYRHYLEMLEEDQTEAYRKNIY